MAVPTVVTLQPQAVAVVTNAKPMWQTGLMDCCTDWSVCCCGLFCFPCLACTVAGDMNECCLCGTSVAMRTMYRTRYNIPGSICSDFCITSCCPVCSVCQIKRDINRRRAMGIFWSSSTWHTGLLDCMSDCSVCICGAFCYPCLGCQVANAMDEFCLCGGSVAMRTLYRTRYNIPGSILGDYYSVMCCPMCALCQLKRDIDYRREQRTF